MLDIFLCICGYSYIFHQMLTAEVAAELGTGTPLYRIGMNDQYCTMVGTQEYLRNEYGLSAEKIAEFILEKIKG